MSVIQHRSPDSVSGARVTKDAEKLSSICEPNCAGIIWHRHPTTEFQDWIDDLEPENLPNGRLVLKPNMVRDAVSNLCYSAGTPDSSHREWLINDIAALANIFADVMDPPLLRVRLDKVTSNACRKFHVDALTARLICTYRGTGTQYGVSHTQADPDRIFTVPAGSPFVLRGTKWPTTSASGLLHRSPPIEGSGETRLVLVLDPVLDEADG